MVAQKLATFPEPLNRQFDNLIAALTRPSLPLLREYSDNAAALAAGQKTGDMYRLSDGTVKVVV